MRAVAGDGERQRLRDVERSAHPSACDEVEMRDLVAATREQGHGAATIRAHFERVERGNPDQIERPQVVGPVEPVQTVVGRHPQDVLRAPERHRGTRRRIRDRCVGREGHVLRIDVGVGPGLDHGSGVDRAIRRDVRKRRIGVRADIDRLIRLGSVRVRPRLVLFSTVDPAIRRFVGQRPIRRAVRERSIRRAVRERSIRRAVGLGAIHDPRIRWHQDIPLRDVVFRALVGRRCVRSHDVGRPAGVAPPSSSTTSSGKSLQPTRTTTTRAPQKRGQRASAYAIRESPRHVATMRV